MAELNISDAREGEEVAGLPARSRPFENMRIFACSGHYFNSFLCTSEVGEFPDGAYGLQKRRSPGIGPGPSWSRKEDLLTVLMLIKLRHALTGRLTVLFFWTRKGRKK